MKCDRIYKIHTLTLPGGYKLPFSVIVYSETENELETVLITELQNLQWMGAYSQNYQLSQMSAGTILVTTRQAEVVDDIYVLCSKYRCNEMIGKKCNKEFTEVYGKRN